MIGILGFGLKGERKCDDMARMNRRVSMAGAKTHARGSQRLRLLKRLPAIFPASPPNHQHRKFRRRHVEAELGEEENSHVKER